uniref:Uncharacterized protein n=1 Tax=Mycetohabitans sp. TaxID=2571162 RepID=A0A6B9HDF1_9BURK|nr:hypothetical protein [Mycetohabitans sp.]
MRLVDDACARCRSARGSVCTLRAIRNRKHEPRQPVDSERVHRGRARPGHPSVNAEQKSWRDNVLSNEGGEKLQKNVRTTEATSLVYYKNKLY